jgi:hypothetical protein
MHRLGMICLQGSFGVPVNAEKGFTSIKLAAAQGISRRTLILLLVKYTVDFSFFLSFLNHFSYDQGIRGVSWSLVIAFSTALVCRLI